MSTDTRPTLQSVLDSVNAFDEPCSYRVFRNQVLIEERELELYTDYLVEGLSVRSGFSDEPPYLVIYLV